MNDESERGIPLEAFVGQIIINFKWREWVRGLEYLPNGEWIPGCGQRYSIVYWPRKLVSPLAWSL
jgi:hypothetical protein